MRCIANPHMQWTEMTHTHTHTPIMLHSLARDLRMHHQLPVCRSLLTFLLQINKHIYCAIWSKNTRRKKRRKQKNYGVCRKMAYCFANKWLRCRRNAPGERVKNIITMRLDFKIASFAHSACLNSPTLSMNYAQINTRMIHMIASIQNSDIFYAIEKSQTPTAALLNMFYDIECVSHVHSTHTQHTHVFVCLHIFKIESLKLTEIKSNKNKLNGKQTECGDGRDRYCEKHLARIHWHYGAGTFQFRSFILIFFGLAEND